MLHAKRKSFSQLGQGNSHRAMGKAKAVSH
jgi:hypothetical protein